MCRLSELVDCMAFDCDSSLSHSTDDHNIDTDSSLEYFVSLGNLCKLTPLLLQPIVQNVLTIAQLK